MYGTKPISALETKGHFTLSNGMYCVMGVTSNGNSIDVYSDSSKKKLISMQHGIGGNMINFKKPTRNDIQYAKMFMESMVNEF